MSAERLSRATYLNELAGASGSRGGGYDRGRLWVVRWRALRVLPRARTGVALDKGDRLNR